VRLPFSELNGADAALFVTPAGEAGGLSAVCARYGLLPEEVMRANPGARLQPGELFRPGTRLLVLAGRAAGEAAAASAPTALPPPPLLLLALPALALAAAITVTTAARQQQQRAAPALASSPAAQLLLPAPDGENLGAASVRSSPLWLAAALAELVALLAAWRNVAARCVTAARSAAPRAPLQLQPLMADAAAALSHLVLRALHALDVARRLLSFLAPYGLEDGESALRPPSAAMLASDAVRATKRAEAAAAVEAKRAQQVERARSRRGGSRGASSAIRRRSSSGGVLD
jgi:hypothetical protein